MEHLTGRWFRWTGRLRMRVRSTVRVSATVTLLVGLAVALVGAAEGRAGYPPHTTNLPGVGTQAGGMHMFPPHTPIIKG
jgi:hypothetical protein